MSRGEQILMIIAGVFGFPVAVLIIVSAFRFLIYLILQFLGVFTNV